MCTEAQLSSDRPLDEAWWEDGPPADEWIPPEDAPILAPYDRTQAGFELIVPSTVKDAPDWDCFPVGEDGHQRINLWDIWKQDKDLAGEDQEKQKINGMQLALGVLSDDDRYIRIQIACLERCFWTFPANVDLILDGFASGKANLGAGISCEPPWTGIRLILSHRLSASGSLRKPPIAYTHHQQGLDPAEDQRQKLMLAYARIISWWSAEGSLEHLKLEMPTQADLAENIYRWLGRPTRLKWLYVQKLAFGLNLWAIPGLPCPGRRERMLELGKVLDAKIQDELPGQEDSIGRLIERNNDNGPCHHAFFRHLDHIIAHIGAGQPVRLPGAGEERKRVHEMVTDYVHALGSWLAGRTPQVAVSIWPASEEVVHRVFEILGESSRRKRWLAACLWKKLQDNQAHNGRGALDEQPDRFALPPDALKA